MRTRPAVAVERTFSGGHNAVALRCMGLQPLTIRTLILLKHWLRLSALSLVFASLSIFSLPYSCRSPFDTVFFADRPVEKYQSICTVTVTVIPSPYLSRQLTA